MAQPNVVREPSMEEILASIRRIIESNEPGGGKPISSTHFAPANNRDDDIQLTVDEEFAAADRARAAEQDPRFVAANSQMPIAENSQMHLAEQESANRGLSLADVAARVRAASERNAAMLSAGREMPQHRELPPVMAARLAEARVEPISDVPLRNSFNDVVASAVAPAAESLPAAEVEVEAEIVEAISPEATAAPQVSSPVFHAPEPLHPAVSVESEANQSQPSIPAPAASPLLSEAAGAQISRSFEELAAIVDGGPRRSLDELAQEMLRPMLQEWLDDNLPTLVERLVREEIERVARGPRR
ncbi:DUF2497 domain-containing protein [Rhizobium sp. P38BS-XIX]|uniref:PopZ family protein n=1 Tax=Rhizobium sp. P38BS-XIX TaxID=2726740 RepID=UPI0014574F8E|nr:DUF2497 domain-containing protein [Rhizobium sp. P38BS-XIX]NLR95890.1 DUF2497 domain-containing protein [Rhizobium sp. P38BS-XIX]